MGGSLSGVETLVTGPQIQRKTETTASVRVNPSLLMACLQEQHTSRSPRKLDWQGLEGEQPWFSGITQYVVLSPVSESLGRTYLKSRF